MYCYRHSIHQCILYSKQSTCVYTLYIYAERVTSRLLQRNFNHTRYVTKMMIYLPLRAQTVLYLCLLQLARDGRDVGSVVVVRLGSALVLVLLLRWCLKAAVLVFIAVEDYTVSTQIQALASPVAWFSFNGPIGKRSVREQPLAIDGVLPISIVRSSYTLGVLIGSDTCCLGGRCWQAISTEAPVIQTPADRVRGQRGRQGPIRGGPRAHTSHGDGPLAGGSTAHAAHTRSSKPLTQPATAPMGRDRQGGQAGPQVRTLHKIKKQKHTEIFHSSQ